MAFSLNGSPWENRGLLEELLEQTSPSATTGYWAVWNWSTEKSPPAPLLISFSVPEELVNLDSSTQFLESVAQQLDKAFTLFCEERGWPKPRFQLKVIGSDSPEWSYEIEIFSRKSGLNHIKPNKLLIIGEHQQLAGLLGLETLDPVLGLPAKWIARSQLENALESDLHLFNGPGVVTAHALHLASENFHLQIGFLELQSWLHPALASHGPLVETLIREHCGLLLRLVKDLVSQHLWLPHPARFCELFIACLPELDPDEPDPFLLSEMLRKEIVAINIERWLDSDQQLRAIEWRGEADNDDAVQSRLMIRLADALSKAYDTNPNGVPIVLTDFESRAGLALVLQGPYPTVPILSWAEIPTHVPVNLVAVVDATFEVDPSPWHSTIFEVQHSSAVQKAHGQP